MFVREWRLDVGSSLDAKSPGAGHASPAGLIYDDFDAPVQVRFLYASPLVWERKLLSQLDIAAAEVRGIEVEVQCATLESLVDALVVTSAGLSGTRSLSVLHISAHCAVTPNGQFGLLEDGCSKAHAIAATALLQLGVQGAGKRLLLVMLTCGSVRIAQGLVLQSARLRLLLMRLTEGAEDVTTRTSCGRRQSVGMAWIIISISDL